MEDVQYAEVRAEELSLGSKRAIDDDSEDLGGPTRDRRSVWSGAASQETLRSLLSVRDVRFCVASTRDQGPVSNANVEVVFGADVGNVGRVATGADLQRAAAQIVEESDPERAADAEGDVAAVVVAGLVTQFADSVRILCALLAGG